MVNDEVHLQKDTLERRLHTPVTLSMLCFLIEWPNMLLQVYMNSEHRQSVWYYDKNDYVAEFKFTLCSITV